jgi:hypothetical protein
MHPWRSQLASQERRRGDVLGAGVTDQNFVPPTLPLTLQEHHGPDVPPQRGRYANEARQSTTQATGRSGNGTTYATREVNRCSSTGSPQGISLRRSAGVPSSHPGRVTSRSAWGSIHRLCARCRCRRAGGRSASNVRAGTRLEGLPRDRRDVPVPTRAGRRERSGPLCGGQVDPQRTTRPVEPAGSYRPQCGPHRRGYEECPLLSRARPPRQGISVLERSVIT